MATGLRVATALCRTAVTGLAAAALACSIRAPDVSFVALVFLKVALVLDLFWHLPRLVYDGAHLFFQVPLPAHGLLFSVLVVVEWAAMVVLLAAVSSTTGVLVFFQVDTRACLPPTSVHSVACSYWHGVSGYTHSLRVVAQRRPLLPCFLAPFLPRSPPLARQVLTCFCFGSETSNILQ